MVDKTDKKLEYNGPKDDGLSRSLKDLSLDSPVSRHLPDGDTRQIPNGNKDPYEINLKYLKEELIIDLLPDKRLPSRIPPLQSGYNLDEFLKQKIKLLDGLYHDGVNSWVSRFIADSPKIPDLTPDIACADTMDYHAKRAELEQSGFAYEGTYSTLSIKGQSKMTQARDRLGRDNTRTITSFREGKEHYFTLEVFVRKAESPAPKDHKDE